MFLGAVLNRDKFTIFKRPIEACLIRCLGVIVL